MASGDDRKAALRFLRRCRAAEQTFVPDEPFYVLYRAVRKECYIQDLERE